MKETLIDIETYCEADIKKCGLYRYVSDPSFEILLIAWATDEGSGFGETRLVDLASGEPFPQELLDDFKDRKVTLIAHNAAFERVSFSRYAKLASSEVKRAVRKSAKTVKEEIEAGAPSRTGRYKSSWVATKQEESSQSLQIIVHSKDRYQLAHLLEKGHAKRGGGRVAARPHIAPAEQEGVELLQSLIEKALK